MPDIKIGPLGNYPMGGPVHPGDRGDLNAAFGRLPGLRLMVMNFGTALGWCGAPPEQTMRYVEAFRTKVKKEFGDLPYDASGLPFRVEARGPFVVTFFGQSIGQLVANPELFLGWAERLEDIAKVMLAARVPEEDLPFPSQEG